MAAHCAICLSNCPLDRFAVFPCGHGFCTECISTLCSQPRPKCPKCRVALHRRDAHPLHIDFIDSHTVFQMSVVDGLNQMDADTPLISVTRASQKIGKIVAEGSKDGITGSSLLVQAVKDFKERIIPVFTKVKIQDEEIDNLHLELQILRREKEHELQKLRREKEHLEGKLKKTEPLKEEVDKLKSALSEAEWSTNEALRLAESVKDELLGANQWKKRATELEQDNKRYKDMLDRHTNSARVQKEKNKKLSKRVAALTERLAREEKEVAATSNEYDGDFSAHESSRVHLESSMRAIPRTPSKPSSRRRYCDENKTELVLEGIPSANFPSDWQIEAPNVLRKRNVNGIIVSGHRRVTNPFPINLDRNGHPTKAVQLGPRSGFQIGCERRV